MRKRKSREVKRVAPVGELQEVAKAEMSRPGPLHQPVTRRTGAGEKPGKGRLTGDQLINYL